jgi:hypothetical protein
LKFKRMMGILSAKKHPVFSLRAASIRCRRLPCRLFLAPARRSFRFDPHHL